MLYRIDSILFGTQSSSLSAQHFVYRVSWSSDGCICLSERRHCSPSSSRTPLVPVKAKMSVGQSEMEPLPFRVPRDYPHSRFSKAPLAVYPPKGARAKAWWVTPPPPPIFPLTNTGLWVKITVRKQSVCKHHLLFQCDCHIHTKYLNQY